MNTDPKSTASQLRLAANLLETGHPYEYRLKGEDWTKYAGDGYVQYHLNQGHQIRPVLATPPYGRSLHNPDNLTAEQVGVGYRLVLEGEQPHKDAERWEKDEAVWESRGSYTGKHYGSVDTYRLPLSVPWPDVPEAPDPYAELGPEDVPPGSVMRPGHWTGPVWIKVNKVCITDCRLEGEKSMTWEYLKTHGYQINYPRHRDSSGNPTLWFPCHKTIPQNG